MTTAIQTQPAPFQLESHSGSIMLAGGDAFAHIQRVAKLFAASDLVPERFKGKEANCTIALEMAHRMGANPMAVMQNLYVVHGTPGWSAQFVIACLNQCGKFSPLRFRMEGEGDKRSCVAYALELATQETLEGPPVSIEIAKKEGWFQKNGSKWQSIPELMLRYRAAAFFGRLYAPDIMMGMQTAEEVADVATERNVTPSTPLTVAAVRALEATAQATQSAEEPTTQKAATRAKQEKPDSSESPADDKVQRNELVGKIVTTLKGFGLSIPQVLPELAARELFDAGRQPADVIKLPIETLARIAEQAEAIGAEAKERRAGE